MPKRPTPQKHSDAVILRNVSVVDRTATSVGVSGNGLLMQVGILAPDVFRLRICRGRQFSQLPSWAATEKPGFPPCIPRRHESRGQVTLRTDQGEFSFNLLNGRWTIKDRYGLTLFESVAGGTEFVGTEARLHLSLEDDESLFGLGETTGTFNKRGLIREFWNIDVGGHSRTVDAGVRSLYLSIPFALSLRHGRAAGLFWDNPARQTWDLGQTKNDQWALKAASGEVDCYFFLGPTFPAILERYTQLTGRMPLPPSWALGYQQCRYSYETRERLEGIAKMFRRKQIPCDVLYLDIHHMDGYRVFTFGKSFPQPRQMIERLARQGFKLVTIVDPGVKDDPQFPVLQRGVAERGFVKAPDGESDYRGKVWPGLVRFPDFLHTQSRRWWGVEQKHFQMLGVAGYWNDMNEPADFSQPEKDFPGDTWHTTDWGQLRHAEVHNVYGSEMARASYEGALAHQPGHRPFIVTRAGYAGVQRYAAVWTGDNESAWEQLDDSVQMVLNLSVSGVAFCGADVGGFHHNATGELLARWTQLGSFTPFFRNHSDINTLAQEPWAFGPKIEAICLRYINLRYQLLPYWYALFLEAHRSGAPIIRPLFWHYPNDPTAAAASDQFLVGADLLIAPILRQGALARSVYLPVGVWFDFWTGAEIRGGQHVLAHADLEVLPIFVRAGTILPMIPVQQYVGEKRSPTVNLHVWPGTDGRLTWYEDDETSCDYERGAFCEREILQSSKRRTRKLSFSRAQGSFPSRVKRWHLILRNSRRPVRVKVAGEPMTATFHPDQGICLIEVTNRSEAFEVEWH